MVSHPGYGSLDKHLAFNLDDTKVDERLLASILEDPEKHGLRPRKLPVRSSGRDKAIFERLEGNRQDYLRRCESLRQERAAYRDKGVAALPWDRRSDGELGLLRCMFENYQSFRQCKTYLAAIHELLRQGQQFLFGG